MGTDLPQVIWESEHSEGQRFRIVRRQVASSAATRVEHILEQSAKEDVDAMGLRAWSEATPTYALVETLLGALLRELPS